MRSFLAAAFLLGFLGAASAQEMQCTTDNPTPCFSYIYGSIAKGAGSLATSQATVGTTATQIVAARPGRSTVTIVNPGTVPVFVGPAGVTAATGVPIPAGGSLLIATSAAVFGVVATGTQAVSALELY